MEIKVWHQMLCKSFGTVATPPDVIFDTASCVEIIYVR